MKFKRNKNLFFQIIDDHLVHGDAAIVNYERVHTVTISEISNNIF